MLAIFQDILRQIRRANNLVRRSKPGRILPALTGRSLLHEVHTAPKGCIKLTQCRLWRNIIETGIGMVYLDGFCKMWDGERSEWMRGKKVVLNYISRCHHFVEWIRQET